MVVLTTDRDERVSPGAELSCDAGRLVVTSARGETMRSHRGGERRRWIVRFEGYADRTAADRLRGLVLRAVPIDDPEALWAHDLVGAEVVLAGSSIPVGRCVAQACVDNSWCGWGEVCRLPPEGGLPRCQTDYDNDLRPYCSNCVYTPGQDSCGKGANFCLFSTYTGRTYCGVDCSELVLTGSSVTAEGESTACVSAHINR